MADLFLRKDFFDFNTLTTIKNKLTDYKEKLKKSIQYQQSKRCLKVLYQSQKSFYFFVDSYILVCDPEIYKFKTFKKIQKQDIEKYIKSLNLPEGFSLLDTKAYKTAFFKETFDFLDNGKIKNTEGKILFSNFILENDKTLNIYDSNLEKTSSDTGVAVPFLNLKEKFNIKDNNAKSLIDWLIDLELTPIDNTELKNKIEDIISINSDLKLIEKIINNKSIEDESFSNITNKFIEEDICNLLLTCDKKRIQTTKYDLGILTDRLRGHWDLFTNEDILTKDKDNYIKFFLNNNWIARDPHKDINNIGTVSIDFGTKSSVVAYQKNNDAVHLLSLSYTVNGDEKYENPTVMEFVDIDSFMDSYKGAKGRPYTKLSDLTISYEALSRLIAGSKNVLNCLKQWCGSEKEVLILNDASGKTITLPPYLSLQDDDIDPIELYAYYIGSYINNMQSHNIFTNYLLSYPVSFSKEVCEKLQKSFEKGLKKSLPQALLEDGAFLENFSVKLTCSEPTAYAMYALDKSAILNSLEDDSSILYGVFDLGGGTADFSYGTIVPCTESARYSYDLHVIADRGHKYVGGENILRALAYNIFVDNKEILRKNEITFYCPANCEFHEECADLVVASYQSNFNMQALCEKIRPYWEEQELENKDIVKLSLLDVNGNIKDGVELSIDIDALDEIIYTTLSNAVKSFFNELKSCILHATENLDFNKLYVILSGKASQHPILVKLFDEHFKELKDKCATKERNSSRNTINQDTFIILDSSKYHLDLKKGTAIGLLNTAKGSKFKIHYNQENKTNGKNIFKYIIGLRNRANIINPIIYAPKCKTGEWYKLIDASDDFADIYVTEDTRAISKNLSTADPNVKKYSLKTDFINDDAYIYVKITSLSSIEYMVALDGDENNPLSEIKQLNIE